MLSTSMVFQFSKNLIQDIQLCFFEEHGLSISQEQAQEYLSSFADLYLVFGEANARLHPGGVGGRPTTQAETRDRGVSNTSGTL